MNQRKRMNAGMYTSSTVEWGTPKKTYEEHDLAFGFTIDVCASEVNHKHPRYLTKKDNALIQSWEGETFFMNPPYGDEIPAWMQKARESCEIERAVGLCLVPARVDTVWWHTTVQAPAGRLIRSYYVPESGVFWMRWARLVVGFRLHDQRIPFEGNAGDGAPFPSAFVIMASVDRELKDPRGIEWVDGRAPLTYRAPL